MALCLEVRLIGKRNTLGPSESYLAKQIFSKPFFLPFLEGNRDVFAHQRMCFVPDDKVRHNYFLLFIMSH